MVTYFNRKDLVSFGNYLLSEERRIRKIKHRDELIKQGANPPLIEDTINEVSHADIENWKHQQKN
ncbi:MAG: hypothetical protein N4A35_05420 [Flavobacteriales bacterium]|jgi:hypothetical protein|nr:hypothetical protein [Flavobacteriales bacterium]